MARLQDIIASVNGWVKKERAHIEEEKRTIHEYESKHWPKFYSSSEAEPAKPEVMPQDIMAERELELKYKYHFSTFKQRLLAVTRPALAYLIASPFIWINVNVQKSDWSPESNALVNEAIVDSKRAVISTAAVYGVYGAVSAPLIIRRNRRKLKQELAYLHINDNPNELSELNPWRNR